MVTEPVKQPVRVRHHAWRRQGHQRAHRRRLALERQSFRQSGVHIRVEARFVFDEIRAIGLHRDAGRRRADLEADLHCGGNA